MPVRPRPRSEEPGPVTSSTASDGDIRVLLALDLLLSLAFSLVVVWGLDFVGLGTFTAWNVTAATLTLAARTYLVVLR